MEDFAHALSCIKDKWSPRQENDARRGAQTLDLLHTTALMDCSEIVVVVVVKHTNCGRCDGGAAGFGWPQAVATVFSPPALEYYLRRKNLRHMHHFRHFLIYRDDDNLINAISGKFLTYKRYRSDG
uniref:Uncharacterized protein n=1 Tax=Romanomermis culicivorax TaxID=13658 RepID=A0A915HH49_ROMCU